MVIPFVAHVPRRLLLAGMLAGTGCAAFRHGGTEIAEWPPTSSKPKQSINLEIQGIQGQLFADWQRQAVKACEDSGRFTKVLSDPAAHADLRAQIAVKHEVGGTWTNAGMRFLTGVTLFIVPGTATDDFHVTTKFVDASGKTVSTFEESTGATLWLQTLLIFFAPFKTVGAALDATYYDATRAALDRASRDGQL